jgi:hypothetical protein
MASHGFTAVFLYTTLFFRNENICIRLDIIFFLFFCLDTKETKNQGQPERLRAFVRPSPPQLSAEQESIELKN